MSVEVLNECDLDEAAFDGLDPDHLEEHLVTLSRFVMDRMRVHVQAELCIKLVDEATIAQLNEQWMGKEGPTDVLAFPMDELRPGLLDQEPEEGVLGDLMIAPSVARKQGEVMGHGTIAEIELLTTHGILHLLGYDHLEADEKADMFTLQATLLKDFGSVATPPPAH